jgi:hypothetical protein
MGAASIRAGTTSGIGAASIAGGAERAGAGESGSSEMVKPTP